jgi:soluble lytic murein transglycosylase
MALDLVDQQHGVMVKAKADKEEAAVADAMRHLLANGGAFADLPADMKVKIAPKDVSGVMDFAAKLSKGAEADDLSLYNDYAVEPQLLAKLSDDQFMQLRGKFTDTTFKALSKTRADLINGEQPDAQNPASINSAAVKETLD